MSSSILRIWLAVAYGKTAPVFLQKPMLTQLISESTTNGSTHSVLSWLTHSMSLVHGLDASSLDPHLLLQTAFKETDIASDLGKTWNHFIKTGQVWAFLIGISLGYLAKTFTSFG